MRQGKRKNADRSGEARDASSHFQQPLAEGGLVDAHRDGDFLALGEDGEAFGDLDGVGADGEGRYFPFVENRWSKVRKIADLV